MNQAGSGAAGTGSVRCAQRAVPVNRRVIDSPLSTHQSRTNSKRPARECRESHADRASDPLHRPRDRQHRGKAIGELLALMRWLVIVVILYAAASMLRSARAPTQELAQHGIELPR